MEIKAGQLYRKQMYDGVPLTFDVGDHAQVDVVRITWTNGLIQNETKQAAEQVLPVRRGAAALRLVPHDLDMERPRIRVHHGCAGRGAAGRKRWRRVVLPGGSRRVCLDSRQVAAFRSMASMRCASPKS